MEVGNIRGFLYEQGKFIGQRLQGTLFWRYLDLRNRRSRSMLGLGTYYLPNLR